jgi:D-alanyl-D-alanine carboxypeptidase/D-alanyl-D-alanine-endopeptidase (penicillin-binding protein 4)
VLSRLKLNIEFAIILLLLLPTSGCGFRPVDVDISFGEEKPASSGEIALMKSVSPDNVGYMLYDLDRKTVVRSHNPSRAFIPASTTKLPVTVTALNVLGPGYRFNTFLCYTGSIKDGVIKGDLYLKGTGDPFLTVTDLMTMIDRMKDKGISAVSGHFYFDESDLASAVCIDSSMESDVSFNPGVSALSLEYNTVTAEWKRNKKTNTMDIFLIPSLPVNSASLSREKLHENTKFAYHSLGGTESWLLSPDEDRNGSERLPVKQPARYTAQVFAKICEIRGVPLPAPQSGTMPSGVTSIITHQGQPLSSIADITLTYSINLMAELLSLRTAKKLSGKTVDMKSAAGKISSYLSEKLDKINWKNLRLVNGSGLTVDNRITPEQMVAVLIYADAQNYDGRKYRSFLPSSGWEWSLMNRFSDPETALHIWAKTGTINYAMALAGYLYTKSHRNMAFAVFIHDIAERRMYDADPDRRNKGSMKKVHAWLNNSKSVMDSIVTGWIKEL